jgi:hypothetical protein
VAGRPDFTAVELHVLNYVLGHYKDGFATDEEAATIDALMDKLAYLRPSDDEPPSA